MKKIYVIAGCNGAGKTTASYTVLPEILQCREFVNADEIAKGLSPFRPEKVSFQAGRIMLNRMRSLIDQHEEFAFETTLSTKSYVTMLNDAKDIGYKIILLFFWLPSSEMAIDRVKTRVNEGGHDIPETVIRRRFGRGLKNLFQLYIPVSDNWVIINNSSSPFQIIAEGNRKEEKIYIKGLWQEIKSLQHD